jgi:hypothetical protein
LGGIEVTDEPFQVSKAGEKLEELKSAYDALAYTKEVLDGRAYISLSLEFYQLRTRVGALVDSAEKEYHTALEQAARTS